MTVVPDDIKLCCAAAYSTAAARFLLGESFHPGGAALTARLGAELQVGPGATVVDVASGPGTSALELARECGCDVVGVDLSADSVAAATEAAEAAGYGDRVRFTVGDAEALPFDDASMDGALCECALCTFPDKGTAAAEIARVLRPGARLALSDMTADTERLPLELKSLHAWVACIADARPLAELAALIGRAGFTVERVERHDEALERLLERVDARLSLAGVVTESATAVAAGRDVGSAARDAVAAGTLGYGVVVARRV